VTRRLLQCLQDAIYRAESQEWQHVWFMRRQLDWDRANRLEVLLEERLARRVLQ